jgi:hypothetical protein
MKNSSTTNNNDTVLPNSNPLVLDCVKDVSILFDKNKKQYSIKIPKEIVELLGIKKKDIMRLIVMVREGQPLEGRFGVVKK